MKICNFGKGGMVIFISPRTGTHERLHHTKERWLVVSNAPCPTLELETEPEHRLITLQRFTRTGSNHGPDRTRACETAQSDTDRGGDHCDDVDQLAAREETRLEVGWLLQISTPVQPRRVPAGGARGPAPLQG